MSRLDRAYSERNYAVILAAKLAIKAGFKAGWGLDANEDWDDEWRVVVYIEGEEQASWHMSPDCAELAKQELPKFNDQWDGTYLSRTSEVCKIVK